MPVVPLYARADQHLIVCEGKLGACLEPGDHGEIRVEIEAYNLQGIGTTAGRQGSQVKLRGCLFHRRIFPRFLQHIRVKKETVRLPAEYCTADFAVIALRHQNQIRPHAPGERAQSVL